MDNADGGITCLQQSGGMCGIFPNKFTTIFFPDVIRAEASIYLGNSLLIKSREVRTCRLCFCIYSVLLDKFGLYGDYFTQSNPSIKTDTPNGHCCSLNGRCCSVKF